MSEVRGVYKGAVYDHTGRTMAEVVGETGGYAPLVTLELTLSGGRVHLWLEPSEAHALGEALTAAAKEVEANV